MREYASITLHMTEYIGIYLKKTRSAEYAMILNVSNEVHSTSSLYKFLSSYRDRDVFRTLSNVYDESFFEKTNA